MDQEDEGTGSNKKLGPLREGNPLDVKASLDLELAVIGLIDKSLLLDQSEQTAPECNIGNV